ncbi:unnamed protein product [Amoebophrya sp. A25]|nr:unnamed protein product [Amoebophrya sp. A25]|eukprot:GSA25T00022124001.1
MGSLSDASVCWLVGYFQRGALRARCVVYISRRPGASRQYPPTCLRVSSRSGMAYFTAWRTALRASDHVAGQFMHGTGADASPRRRGGEGLAWGVQRVPPRSRVDRWRA